MRKSIGFYVFIIFTAIVCPTGTTEEMADLLQGVEKIGLAGAPGPICVFGEKAFSVIAGAEKDLQVPLVAAAEYGAGRVVAFGHEGYLSPGAIQQADTLKFFKNCIQWTANRKKQPDVGVLHNEKLITYLIAQKVDACGADVINLNSIDVLVLSAGQINAENIKVLNAFVADGGGLITAGLGWGWKQLNPGKSLQYDFAANQLLAPMGLVWADGMANKTCDEGYHIKPFDADLLNASKAFERLVDAQRTNKPLAHAKQISATLTLAIRSLPDDDMIFAAEDCPD